METEFCQPVQNLSNFLGENMIEVATNMNQLELSQLAAVYRESCTAEGLWDMFDYLRQCFFPGGGAVYCLRKDGVYVCVLRLEPYRDGLLLTALETAPEHRRRGYAKQLLRGVLERIHGKVYSHIDDGNRASIAVHQACGFVKMLDHAVYLDGSVSTRAGTYLKFMQY